jgi:hypothetical protein
MTSIETLVVRSLMPFEQLFNARGLCTLQGCNLRCTLPKRRPMLLAQHQQTRKTLELCHSRSNPQQDLIDTVITATMMAIRTVCASHALAVVHT